MVQLVSVKKWLHAFLGIYMFVYEDIHVLVHASLFYLNIFIFNYWSLPSTCVATLWQMSPWPVWNSPVISSVCPSFLIDRKRCHSIYRKGRSGYLSGSWGVRPAKQQPLVTSHHWCYLRRLLWKDGFLTVMLASTWTISKGTGWTGNTKTHQSHWQGLMVHGARVIGQPPTCAVQIFVH